MTAKIYALVHPITDEIKYIGKCITPLAVRVNNHQYKARSGRIESPLSEWLLGLNRIGLKPIAIALEEVTSGTWQAAERRWIARCRAVGVHLFNRHDGGNGAHTRAALLPKFVRLLGKLPDAEIAKQAGLCRETIGYHRRRIGIAGIKTRRSPTTPPRRTKKQLPNEVLPLLGKVSDETISKQFGFARTTLRRWRRELDIPAYPTAAGTNHPRASVDQALVLLLRQQYVKYSLEFGCDGLAKKYKLERTAVWAIVTRKTYKEEL